MGDEDDEPALHAALNGVVERKLLWLDERGVSLSNPTIVGRDLSELLKYIEKEQITSIPLDELKSAWHAIDENGVKEMNELFAGGADIDSRDEDGKSTLHKAAELGMIDMVKVMLDHGADVNAVDDYGRTALLLAAHHDMADVVAVLLERGADVAVIGNDGRTTLHRAALQGSVVVTNMLLDRDADVNAGDKRGRTALHLAVSGKMVDCVAVLLDRGANVDAVDEGNHSPLSSIIWSKIRTDLNEKAAIARLLCSRGANPNVPASISKSSLKQRQIGLLACANHWHKCYEQREPLTEIPTEVIKGGKDTVRTFLDDLVKTDSDQLVYRSKVCIIGPSTWGKTSLVKSMTMNKPSLMDIKDRTIGIDLFPFTFDENSNGWMTSMVKRHDVTFWDFAGQDVYQVTHALFYSERTLYLICVDLSVYATKLDVVKTCTKTKKNAIMQRFFEENVLHRVRLILFRQPSAQFKVIGTKDDLISEAQLEDILVDMNCRMNLFVDKLDIDGIADEVKIALDAEFEQNNLVTTSARRVESIEKVRKAVEQAIIAKPNLSFMMPATYSQVLEHIFKIKRASESATPEDRVKQVILPFSALFIKLRRDVPKLEDARECREILRVLHKLGDILWYEDETTNEYDFIILDPKLMLKLIHEVVNHNYESQVGESYEALRRDGTLHHSLLMTFPLWKALEAVDDKMVYLFKYLLQHFDLAYPASNVKELDTVDMIVPTYWKTRAAAQKIVKSLTKQPSILTRIMFVGSVIAKWQYSLPVDISEAVYVNFVVRCYRQDVVRKIGATHVECFVRGEFGAVITFVADKTERHDDIVIEVAAATAEIAWAEMREFVMSMENVLLKYPGLNTTKQKMLKRYIVDPNGNRVVLSGQMDDPNKLERLRYEMPWLPSDFDWFIQRAWENPGKLKELRAQKIILQLSHRLDVLKQFSVSGESRQFPALWTLSYSNEAEAPVIELRIHSDLSGVCYHVPLRIAVPSEFVIRHADLIQNGVSVLLTVSSLIPIDIASNAVEIALAASQTSLDRAQTVKLILAKAGLSRGEVKSATEFDMPVQSRMSFLCELLKLHDPTFDDLKIGEISNLFCSAFNNKGCYVWVHARELEEMKGHLTPCNPPKLMMTPPSTSTSISIRVDRLVWTGRAKSGKKIYCEWEIIHQSRRMAIGKTEESIDSGGDIAWASPSVELADVSSISMLRESTIKVSVKQPHQFARFLDGKEIGHGEVKVKHHVDTDSINSSPVEIEIALEGDTIPPSSAVNCVISCRSMVSARSFTRRNAALTALDKVDNTVVSNSTELMLAVENDRLDVLRVLVESGVDINSMFKNGETALMRAARNNAQDVVRYLVECGANVNAKDEVGDTALMWAARNDAMDVVSTLVEYTANINATNMVGDTALIRAARNDSRNVVGFLVECGANVNAKDEVGDTAIMWAIRYDALDAVRCLVECGANINATDAIGGTVLMWAARNDARKAVRYLVECGANVNATDNVGDTALIRAARYDARNVVGYLVECGANINATDEIGETALMWAARNDALDVVQSLVKSSANANAETKDGDTVLMESAKNGKLTVIQCLVKLGVSINTGNKKGETALMRAAEKGHLEAVRFLVQQNADTRAIDHNEDSTLIRLLNLSKDENTARPIAKLLLEHGCPALHINKDGFTTRSIAKIRGFDVIRDLIKVYEKKQSVPAPIPYSMLDALLILRKDLEKKDLISDGGAFGVVYLGKWKRMDVVIKELRGIESTAEMRTFLREARVWHGARHKNIVSFFGANDREPPFFLVSEFASNGNLMDYLKKEKEKGRSEMWRKILDVAVGLDVLHSKDIIHGDLKGNNIVVSADGTAMLTDFGLSFFEEGSLSISVKLNPRWRAPEYVNGTPARPSTDSDVYSLGMLIVEVVSGEPPWAGLQDEAAIKYHLIKEIPMRKPSSMSDRDWTFVTKMICYTRNERMILKDAITTIEQFAEDETDAEEEISCAG